MAPTSPDNRGSTVLTILEFNKDFFYARNFLAIALLVLMRNAL